MLKKIGSLLLIFAFLICTISNCTALADSTIAVTSIKLNNGSNIYLEVGDVKTLPVTLKPDNATNTGITFTSSNDKIVSIDKSGTVKALKTGTVTLTAEINGRKSSIKATVYVNNNLKASFTESEAIKDKIKNITINVASKDTSQTGFYIFLPTGYMVEGLTATFAADQNGTYPFTVYDDTGTKKTFYYEVNGIDAPNTSIIENENESNFDLNILYQSINLKYDYEKKQCLINAELDKMRTVTLPNNSVIESDEINYYINQLSNNITTDYKFKVEDKELKCKVIRQGEFYLLVIWQEREIDNRNVLVTYRAYNFTTPHELTVSPEMDFITENGSYEILATSDSGLKEIFNFNVDFIDFMRPSINVSITYEDKFEIEVIDNKKLDYIITYDGKYIKIPDNHKANTEFKYKHPDIFKYNGEYMFICVDTSGNRTVATTDIKGVRNVPYIKKLGPNVHNSTFTDKLFSNSGIEYNNYHEETSSYFKSTFPAYMKGITDTKFSPDATITRAQMVAILCRVTDLPYDITLQNKAKFTDIGSHWAKNYICMATSKRYIKGYRDKTFKPNDVLTRADFCKMICNISSIKSKISGIPAVYNHEFKDINQNYTYAKPEILKLANRGIVKGYGENFNPSAPISRAEVIYAINRLYDLTPSDSELAHIKYLYNNYYNFTDIKNNPYYNDIIISIVGMYREIN